MRGRRRRGRKASWTTGDLAAGGLGPLEAWQEGTLAPRRPGRREVVGPKRPGRREPGAKQCENSENPEDS